MQQKNIIPPPHHCEIISPSLRGVKRRSNPPSFICHCEPFFFVIARSISDEAIHLLLFVIASRQAWQSINLTSRHCEPSGVAIHIPTFLDCFTFVRNDTYPSAIPRFATHSLILSSLVLQRTFLLCHPSFCIAKRQGISNASTKPH